MTPIELADKLIGTCTFTTQRPEEVLATQKEVEEFDALAFECEGCGWWCSTEELNDETDLRLCDDCSDAA